MFNTDRRPVIMSGTSHPEFAQRLCAELGCELRKVKHFRFADGEVGFGIEESVRGDDVFVVQPTCNPVNDSLMELLVMCDALRRASVGRINLVVPYFGYARQDRKARAREPITAKLVANLMEKAGADRVITAD